MKFSCFRKISLGFDQPFDPLQIWQVLERCRHYQLRDLSDDALTPIVEGEDLIWERFENLTHNEKVFYASLELKP
jgi:hypothetical protein